MDNQKNFALIGAAGYVAPRHFKAIKETNNQLLVALDKSDSVGVIDSYFPNASFFVEFERFDRHIDKLQQKGINLDFVSICSPNYLHDAHSRFGLRIGADVICEKPLVLNPWNVATLAEKERQTGQRIYTILQLRLHPSIQALKEKLTRATRDKTYDIDLTYLTSRGNWYYASWKGEEPKSGGIATNIGIHFFDMLIWIFGAVQTYQVHHYSHDRAAGYLELERARVRWFLSINSDLLPEAVQAAGKRTYRSLQIDGEEFEFSHGFTDLHTRSYEEILAGRGFGISDGQAAIQLAHDIRHAEHIGLQGDYHPLAKYPLAKHPFTD